MGIGDIRRSCLREQKADSRCIGSIERNEVRGNLAYQPREPRLSGRVAKRLSQRGSRNGHPHAKFVCAHQESDYPPIVPVESDQAASVKSEAAHAALFLPLVLLAPLLFSGG